MKQTLGPIDQTPGIPGSDKNTKRNSDTNTDKDIDTNTHRNTDTKTITQMSSVPGVRDKPRGQQRIVAEYVHSFG